jgi:hypothetical protein
MIEVPRGESPPIAATIGGTLDLFQLESGDIFEFIDLAAAIPQNPQGTAPRLRSSKLRVTIRPWGPRTKAVGPIGPWMFACKDEHGIEHHYALPPRTQVRLLERASLLLA